MTPRGRSAIVVLAFAGALVLPGIASSRAAAQAAREEPPRFKTGSEVVVLDVVVRDKKGRTVRDVRPDELVVLEDGVPQQILSLRLRAAGEAPGDEPASEGAKPQPEERGTAPARDADARHANLVTLVFDQLGVDGRAIARKAGLALAGLTRQSDLLVSVFTIRERLGLVQQFTTDQALVERAVRSATGEQATQYVNATELLQRAVEREAEARQRFESAGAIIDVSQAGLLASLGREVDMARMDADALRLTDTLQREQQGRSSLYALLALARQQQRLAGRKTILFFSEGLQITPNLEHVFHATVSEANRANVSIYAIDARGLTEDRDLTATRLVLEAAAAASQRSMLSRGVGAVPKDQVLALDNAEFSLRMDLQGALNDLAASTGGALIANSNDVRRGIERAVGDLRGYYEVIYAPTNQDYDGRFRKLEVKLASRSDLHVQSRSGYFALPPGEGTATFPFEVELLKALRAYPPPEAFPVRVTAFRFGPEDGGVRHTAVLELPLAGITFAPDDSESDRAHFAILLVIRDVTGAVVEKFSEDSPVVLPRQRREALKAGNAVFLRSFALPAGRYTLEVAVVDQLAKRYGTRRSVLEVPRPAPGLEASELVLIKRAETVPSGALASEDPFRQGGTRLVPWLGEPHVGQSEALSLFTVAYPRKSGPPGDVLLEFLKDGAVVAQTLSAMPAPADSGRSTFLASVPMQELAPGRYEVRVLLKQAGLVANRHAHFVVDPAGPLSSP